MSDLQIVLFGKFRIRHKGEELVGIDGRKTQELLAYLLIHRSRAHAREVLAELLWGEPGGVQSRKYLRQALWQVQSALEPCTDADEPAPLMTDAEWVQLNPVCHLWIDVAQFEEAYLRAQGIPGAELGGPEVERLASAVDLYQGDLLEGCYQDWCIFERERYQNMVLAMLDKLIDWCESRQEFELGLGYGQRILRYDRARERTHRRMMRLYYLAGDRTSALRQYDLLVRTLREELNVKPARRTILLWEEIRADTFQSGPPGGTAGRPPAAGSSPFGDPRTYLQHLHSALLVMHAQIRQELDAIELALSDS